MGWGRVIGSGCLGMLCLIPMAWISFSLLDLTSSVTGGLINNLNDAIASLFFLSFFLGFYAARLVAQFLRTLLEVGFTLVLRLVLVI
ncbi:hypothetical protein ES703_51566 [subsurface metagenome]